MIGIIDYGLGNLRAFANIYKLLNIPFIIASKATDLVNVSKVILPGVGVFDQAMKRLQDSGMRECLNEIALDKKLPVIGICVGMQILTCLSEEGILRGLEWIDGDTKKLSTASVDEPMCIPHMGWNDVRPLKDNNLFKGLGEGSRFYFLHSYYVRCDKSEDALAVTTYGEEFVCAINHKNIYGVQFHPEKSHRHGIRLLKNFSEL
jgi:imidazole glycerol-phosphate synthase subunit HisH